MLNESAAHSLRSLKFPVKGSRGRRGQLRVHFCNLAVGTGRVRHKGYVLVLAVTKPLDVWKVSENRLGMTPAASCPFKCTVYVHRWLLH